MKTAAEALPLKRHVAAVVVGNALEFYDFLTYSFFAVYIGQAYFPSHDPTTSLLASLATFGAGFVTRPLGGIIIGTLGDRVGRKPAMFLSFTLMGMGMLGVVFTPSYATIGAAAPVLVVGFRLIQGFALGGEVGPTTAFLIEAPPAGMRGLYGALQSASQYAAAFAAGCVGTGLSAVLGPAALARWGWRAAFFLGALIIPFGLIVRRSLPETAGAPKAGDEPHVLRAHARLAVLAVLLMAGATIATYVIFYLSTYAEVTLHIAPAWSFGATLTIGLCGTLFAPLGGRLSDRFGRKPVMLTSTCVMIIITIPAFLLLNAVPAGPVLIALAAILTVVFAMGVGVSIMTISEALPARIRSGAMATLYAVSIAIFGGSAQFNVAWLAARLHAPMAPAYYLTVALVVALIAILLFPETAPVCTVAPRE
ncbi:MAG: MFS transporter [Steroidobacteraceae bacterium]|nr:MFS transporter [Steroidobacteraceae bacterium]